MSLTLFQAKDPFKPVEVRERVQGKLSENQEQVFPGGSVASCLPVRGHQGSALVREGSTRHTWAAQPLCCHQKAQRGTRDPAQPKLDHPIKKNLGTSNIKTSFAANWKTKISVSSKIVSYQNYFSQLL